MLDQKRRSTERPATPRVFYELPKRDTLLTLELNYKDMYSSPVKKSNDKSNDDESCCDDDGDVSGDDDKSTKMKLSRTYSSENVSAWMRRSSGVISEDHLTLFHAQLLNDAVKLCVSYNDVNSTTKGGLGKRSFSENTGLGLDVGLGH